MLKTKRGVIISLSIIASIIICVIGVRSSDKNDIVSPQQNESDGTLKTTPTTTDNSELLTIKDYDAHLAKACKDAETDYLRQSENGSACPEGAKCVSATPDNFYKECLVVTMMNDMLATSSIRTLAQLEYLAVYSNKARYLSDKEIVAELKTLFKFGLANFDKNSTFQSAAYLNEYHLRKLNDSEIEKNFKLMLVKYGPCWGIPDGQCRE